MDAFAALGEPMFPDKGMVVGIVLDELGNPASNVVVMNDTGSHISYLSSDRKMLVDGLSK